ncbi:MAG: polyisoprenoid-binding protein [Chloroflexota bacterium]|nr:MAG: polyisoprenoid-binding protein [Chloroflexota bacterium]
MASQSVGTWNVDPSHAQVEFAAKHLMFSTVKGRFAVRAGTIVYDETNPARSSVEVEIDTASVSTGDDKRDGHLKSADFFDAENHPVATFRSTRVDPIGANGAQIQGDLTIRGRTVPVVLSATLVGRGTSPWGTTVIGFSAATTIKRSDWGLTWNVGLETGGVLVGDTIALQIEAEAIKAS